MFEECISLASIEAPDSVKRIGDEGFQGYIILHSVTKFGRLEFLGANPFQFFTRLSELKVIGGNPNFRGKMVP